ncbi:MAG: HEAT repeat domain-containing protein [Terriglobia bacterium]
MKSTVPRGTCAVPTAKAPAFQLITPVSSGENRLPRIDLTRWNADRRMRRAGLFFLIAGLSVLPAFGQVSYSVSVAMEKPKYLLGEPIFCRFVIRNTGRTVFAFRYRTPTRSLASDYNQEPRFQVTDYRGRRLPDPGPRPCGSPKGTTVYGSVTLPPGQVHTERWLLNQWARFTAPGHYHVRAERRLALLKPDPETGTFAEKPAGFAMAIDELNVQVERSAQAEVEEAFHPYLAAIEDSQAPNVAEAVVVLTSMPQPFFFDRLVEMAIAGKPDRWDRRDVLNGLARLNTPASWKAVLSLFRSANAAASSEGRQGAGRTDYPLRSYALLLLAEKGDPAFVPTLVAVLAKSAEPLRGDILRALGFFHDAETYQLLFDNLHSTQVTDRMNAILGLKNLGTKEVIPALLAALNDPEAQVREVANFALVGLTGHKVAVSPNPSRDESERAGNDWHSWWLEHAGSFSPPPPSACHDW